MYGLSHELLEALAGDGPVIVPARHSAQVLRLAHSTAQLTAGRVLWRSPRVLPWQSWLDQLLRAACSSDPALQGLRLLSGAQERYLWQLASFEATGTANAAAALQRSAGLLCEYRLTTTEAPLGTALAAFREACIRRRSISVTLAGDAQLARAAAQAEPRITLAGFAQLTPRQEVFLAQLAAAGSTVLRVNAERTSGADDATLPQEACAADPPAETALAAAWCRDLLRADPNRRLLIVVPDLARERSLLRRAFTATLAPRRSLVPPVAALEPLLRFGTEGAALRQPCIEQALLALAASVRDIAMNELTALLHAPFLGSDLNRIRLDRWLRGLGRAQFQDDALPAALQAAPMALGSAAAWLAQGLARRDELLGPAERPLRDWAERFGAVVDGYGWPGTSSPGAASQDGVAQWREALGDFAGLDSAEEGTRGVDREAALALLVELLDGAEIATALTDAPITLIDQSDLTDRQQAPVVRWDGVWFLGIDASRWPQPPRVDALLPAALQRAAGMPHASVAGRMAQARAALEPWRLAANHVVVSWSRAAGEVRQQRSPLLELLANELGELQPFDVGHDVPTLAQRLAVGAVRRRVPDPRGRPWQRQGLLPGGVRTPELQGDCAFRAYAQLRLGAQPLEVPRAGMDPRLRGSLLHRCLDLLWQELQSSEVLARRNDAQLRVSIEASFDTALASVLAREVLPLDARVVARERRRTVKIVLQLLELERARPAFEVEALEQPVELQVDAATLRFRIDRIDRLHDGARLVIDYKSGEIDRLDLLTERPRPVQLLAYASALSSASVAAMALVKLRRPVKIAAIADADQRLAKLRGTPDWPAQQPRWHAYVVQLVRDFIAGEASVNPQPRACLYCHLPTLCRIDALRLQDQPLDETGEPGIEAGVRDD